MEIIFTQTHSKRKNFLSGFFFPQQKKKKLFILFYFRVDWVESKLEWVENYSKGKDRLKHAQFHKPACVRWRLFFIIDKNWDFFFLFFLSCDKFFYFVFSFLKIFVVVVVAVSRQDGKFSLAVNAAHEVVLVIKNVEIDKKMKLLLL